MVLWEAPGQLLASQFDFTITLQIQQKADDNRDRLHSKSARRAFPRFKPFCSRRATALRLRAEPCGSARDRFLAPRLMRRHPLGEHRQHLR